MTTHKDLLGKPIQVNDYVIFYGQSHLHIGRVRELKEGPAPVYDSCNRLTHERNIVPKVKLYLADGYRAVTTPWLDRIVVISPDTVPATWKTLLGGP